MTAQYKPYRDEESIDGLETVSWTDQEPGSIQIYEKTTEELPLNSVNRRSIWFQSALYLATIIFGFLLGYFGHFHSHEHLNDDDNAISGSKLAISSSLSDFLHEDSTIKDKLLVQLDGNNILKTLNRFKDVPRLPGSAGDHEFAKFVQDELVAYGLDPVRTSNYPFETMLPSKPHVTKLLDKENNTIYSTLTEDPNRGFETIPFLPLSQAEEITFETDQLVYLNKGTKEDYSKLSGLGQNSSIIEGKVLVIRQTFYQMHEIITNAQENGAKAILLFPDPDTFGSSSPFPDSMQLPDNAIKSHPLAWSNYGDLVNLNISSLTGSDISRLSVDKDSKVAIPIQLISFDTAKKLLFGLSGVLAPREWNCFDFTLYIGPGYKEDNGVDKRAKIRMEFYNHAKSVLSKTVTASIPGSIETDRYIIIGSRRDSLSGGVLDSISGTAVMLEIARVFGALAKEGWQPKRTILFLNFGAESLNLESSCHWLQLRQKLLNARAVAYINCDQVVTGNQTVMISASPLLYQVLYNATRQVADPNNQYSKVYESWHYHHKQHKKDSMSDHSQDLHHFLSVISDVEKKLDSETKAALEKDLPAGNEDLDLLESRGSILQAYKASLRNLSRPRVRRLDLQSLYSPFFRYAGVPVVDVRYAGFESAKNETNLVEDTHPWLGTIHDNLDAVQQIDPHLKYHVTVAQIISEIIRDLSDSTYVPFNLIDYAIILRENLADFIDRHGKTFYDIIPEWGDLRKAINDFTVAAIKFHHRQDRSNLNNPMQIRKINDQMIMLERAFLDPGDFPNLLEKRNIIMTPHDGHDQSKGFPGPVEWIALLDGDTLDPVNYRLFIEILKIQYKAVTFTISNAIKILDEVNTL